MTHAQLLLRAYARATNMLIAGRRFITSDGELTALLEAFGAQVITPDCAEDTPSTPTGLDVIFDLDEGAFPRQVRSPSSLPVAASKEFTLPIPHFCVAPRIPSALRGPVRSCPSPRPRWAALPTSSRVAASASPWFWNQKLRRLP